MVSTQERAVSFREWIGLISHEKLEFIQKHLENHPPNETIKWGNTPLHLAAHLGSEKVLGLLLEMGSFPNQKNDMGFTPLHYACREGHIEIVEMLIERNADISSKVLRGNFINWMAVDFAQKQNHEDIVQIFQGLGNPPKFSKEIKSSYETRFFCENCGEAMLVIEEDMYSGAGNFNSEPTDLTFRCENCGCLQDRLV